MHTSPHQPRNNIPLRIAGNTTSQLNDFTDEIASENGSVAECVGVKGLDWMGLAINCLNAPGVTPGTRRWRYAPSVGFCATCDILTSTWFDSGDGIWMSSLERFGDWPSGTRTMTAVFDLSPGILLLYSWYFNKSISR